MILFFPFCPVVIYFFFKEGISGLEKNVPFGIDARRVGILSGLNEIT